MGPVVSSLHSSPNGPSTCTNLPVLLQTICDDTSGIPFERQGICFVGRDIYITMEATNIYPSRAAQIRPPWTIK